MTIEGALQSLAGGMGERVPKVGRIGYWALGDLYTRWGWPGGSSGCMVVVLGQMGVFWREGDHADRI